ncbi:M16 family metallopeptidase [Dyadobacter fanqingshengii]|uniref:Insulinase family protein n=1 Tax=Dyadobacter fanqingshengii TaxID=2906443 RepID=A0A9X1P4N6_9BACT|nr:pitrilysin family protein [Dyadobacter fanqingshengii]MCF0038761.1 insulinase family protein [Dyadobacter fanqingshengii]USJ34410.1 insulinase family protein [Dyadobacter fanqingshengii]
MIIDRTIAPEFRVINSVHLPDPQTYNLDNGTALHVINIGDQPVIRLECIFEAGNWYEQEIGASFFAIKMLSEGTLTKTSAEISEAFDRIGAFTEMTHTADRIGIVVYALSRFLPDVLPLVSELIHDAVFPEKEFQDLKNINIQNLRVNKEKNAYLATTAFRAKLFGSNHPYGQSQEEENISSLSIDTIKEHYQRFVKNGKFTVVLAGQVSENDVKVVNEHLGKVYTENQILPVTDVQQPVYANVEVLVERPDSVQSSIRMGRKLFNRHHPDYFKMLVTNEILGGYFGSRLMKNIREEKGLTYGISSHLVTLRKEGYYMIGTDVKKEFTQQTIDEIKKEIYRLQTELVGEEELQTVKNFMSGEFAGSLNTAFEVADRQKILLLDGLPTDFFKHYIEQIHATTSQDVLSMAMQYLQPEDMLTIIAGGK